MVDMARSHQLDPEVQAIADGILAAQVPEVETMVDWLTDWGKEIPPTSMDHANAHAEDGEGMEMDTDMPGMMTQDRMGELETARGHDFQTMWLEMMIEHHEGSRDGRDRDLRRHFPDAVEMAKSIRESQTAEIEQMKTLLDS